MRSSVFSTSTSPNAAVFLSPCYHCTNASAASTSPSTNTTASPLFHTSEENAKVIRILISWLPVTNHQQHSNNLLLLKASVQPSDTVQEFIHRTLSAQSDGKFWEPLFRNASNTGATQKEQRLVVRSGPEYQLKLTRYSMNMDEQSQSSDPSSSAQHEVHITATDEEGCTYVATDRLHPIVGPTICLQAQPFYHCLSVRRKQRQNNRHTRSLTYTATWKENDAALWAKPAKRVAFHEMSSMESPPLKKARMNTELSRTQQVEDAKVDAASEVSRDKAIDPVKEAGTNQQDPPALPRMNGSNSSATRVSPDVDKQKQVSQQREIMKTPTSEHTIEERITTKQDKGVPTPPRNETAVVAPTSLNEHCPAMKETVDDSESSTDRESKTENVGQDYTSQKERTETLATQPPGHPKDLVVDSSISPTLNETVQKDSVPKNILVDSSTKQGLDTLANETISSSKAGTEEEEEKRNETSDQMQLEVQDDDSSVASSSSNSSSSSSDTSGSTSSSSSSSSTSSSSTSDSSSDNDTSTTSSSESSTSTSSTSSSGSSSSSSSSTTTTTPVKTTTPLLVRKKQPLLTGPIVFQ